MNRLTKRKKIGLVGLTLLLAVGLAHVMVLRVATGPLQHIVERRLSTATGLEIRVDSLQAALLPTPHLLAREVRIAYPNGQTTPDLLRIEHIRLGLSLWPLSPHPDVRDRPTQRRTRRAPSRQGHARANRLARCPGRGLTAPAGLSCQNT